MCFLCGHVELCDEKLTSAVLETNGTLTGPL